MRELQSCFSCFCFNLVFCFSCSIGRAEFTKQPPSNLRKSNFFHFMVQLFLSFLNHFLFCFILGAVIWQGRPANWNRENFLHLLLWRLWRGEKQLMMMMLLLLLLLMMMMMMMIWVLNLSHKFHNFWRFFKIIITKLSQKANKYLISTCVYSGTRGSEHKLYD